VGRISLLIGFAAGEGCSLYAIFVAHVMSPVSYRMVADNLKLRAIYGRYQEIYRPNGLLFTLMTSCLVFAIAWAVVRGEAETGITLMKLDEGMDTGPTFARVATPIGSDETAGELGERLARIGAEADARG